MKKISESNLVVLEGLGFHEKRDGLYTKGMPTGQYAYWDFRKQPSGKFYVTNEDGSFVGDEIAKQLEEYTVFRNQNTEQTQEDKETPVGGVDLILPKPIGEQIVLRGNETQIASIVQQRNLEMIARVSKDGKGEGVLYHDLGLKIGMEPSAELIDMIAQMMGNIEVDVLESGQKRHIDPETDDVYNTYYAVVVARDTKTGCEGLGVAEEIIDYQEMRTGRTFSLTKAIRKAERNAKERLIPVPRKALVELVQQLVEQRTKLTLK